VLEEMTMNIKTTFMMAPALLLFACGASMPPPTQRMADAQSAHRAAEELGAAKQPSAQLHLKLAQEQMDKAKQLMSQGENEEASSLLVRSKADSELAVALAREQKSRADLQAAGKQATATTNLNNAQGAEK
jgi:hypothetical protein